ncbi:MAG: YaeQ family protein [Deltaproteobacteria bacterium]|nr:YaeQ family protein [Deltaproteobacteria bacterium]
MALGATVYHLQIDLSDVDRNVYEALDLRLARHPSETMRFLLTRVLAYCLSYEDGIAFSKGLSTTDEPALWIKDLQGNLRCWIEVGAPSAERLHKASKASPRVVVFTQHDPATLQKAVAGERVHKAESIEVFAFDGAFLDELDAVTDRNCKWVLVRTSGELYVTVKDHSVTGAVTRHALLPG